MPWPSCLQRPGHLGRRLRVFGSSSAPSTCPVPPGCALTGAPDRALPVSLQPLLCLSSKYGESMRGVRMLDAGHAGDLPGHYRNWRRYQLMSSTRENTRLNVRRKRDKHKQLRLFGTQIRKIRKVRDALFYATAPRHRSCSRACGTPSAARADRRCAVSFLRTGNRLRLDHRQPGTKPT